MQRQAGGAQPAGLQCCSCHLRLTGFFEPLLRRTGNYLYEAEFVSSLGLAGRGVTFAGAAFSVNSAQQRAGL